MVFPVVPATTLPPPQAPAQHQYGTRIRSNSVIRPSARLRQLPDSPPVPRRIKPAPTLKGKAPATPAEQPQPELLPFPPPHVVLHPDDATSKVFLAIGRSFMSVDNRAMTIKDLAEMTMKFGLVCQNASAAGQAITTYVRNHLHRCEVQQDQPLLLRHVLSGTVSDDDLVLALHSRVGGAHCTLSTSEKRVTNFRRGTTVWYLSRAAGLPCPFSRVGIRLCDYTENGKVGALCSGRERKRERDRLRRAEQCGQKRKRLLRACADKGSDSDSGTEEEKRPPKVKLTLRLKPSLASGSRASSTAASTPPADPSQPREVIDLCHDSDMESDSDSESDDSDSASDSSSSSIEEAPAGTGTGLEATPGFPSSVSHSPRQDLVHRRSPSVPLSAVSGSPPPDSEDEDEEYEHYSSMMGGRRRYVRTWSSIDEDDEDMDWSDDFFADVDGETETQWESPGPRSPSAQFDDDVVVKQEPNDLASYLDAWDKLDTAPPHTSVADVVAQAAADVDTDSLLRPKREEPDFWDWNGFASADNFMPDDDSTRIKQEEVDVGMPFLVDDLLTPPPDPDSPVSSSSPLSPLTSYGSPLEASGSGYLDARRPSQLMWRDVELLGPDSLKPHDLEDDLWPTEVPKNKPPVTQSARTDCSALASNVTIIRSPTLRSTLPPPPLNFTSAAIEVCHGASSCVTTGVTSPSLLTSLDSLSLLTPVSPNAPEVDSIHRLPVQSDATTSIILPSSSAMREEDDEVIHPSKQYFPPIHVTTLEGLCVYKMALGQHSIIRRVDTDLVNISPIMELLETKTLDTPDAEVVNEGPVVLQGTWVPLPTARRITKDIADLSGFLSGDLPQSFPESVRSCHQSVLPRASSEQAPTPQIEHDARPTHHLDLPDASVPWEARTWEEDDVAVNFPFQLDYSMFEKAASLVHEVVEESPLSPTEEEMFEVLCSTAEWDRRSATTDCTVVEEVTDRPARPSREPPCHDRPLRRSKRVANAIATRARGRPTKRGSRSSLS
ncbi:hypothetical protein CERSUDRAFT_113768 [Gelatoporia subvermispora B]|uniref:GDS1 winged helix domain-containing protein n=1 Tax=Ceriporiopsis subvermispora (strain B) TaxID=914234 RepID=M2PPX7_CERS8|nr:hypothetical protein CERSUDRAFT_113768 [Gelatoporia subvermispora B]